MNRIDLFNNLVIMAAVDGKITQEEAAYLATRAVRWGITEPEAKQALQNATSSVRDFSVPGTKAECLDLLKEMIQMMAVDGELASVEKALCARASVEMDVSPSEFEDLLASMLGR